MSQDVAVATRSTGNNPFTIMFRSVGWLVLGVVTSIILLGIAGLGYCIVTGTLWVHLSSTENVVLQLPVIGNLVAYTEPGDKPRLGGTISRYPKVYYYPFSKSSTKGTTSDESLHVRYADSSHGNLSGSVNFRMPSDEKTLLLLHRTYGSSEAVVNQLIRPTVENAVTMVGSTMTARQSAVELRPELLDFIPDYMQFGVPETKPVEETINDPVTKSQIKVKLAKVVLNPDGTKKRVSKSPMTDYNIAPFGFSIDSITYEQKVEDQLAKLQSIEMAVQESILNSRKAEQEAKTAGFEGEKAKTVAEWVAKEQAAKSIVDAKRDKEVAETKAAQQKRVAELAMEAAEFKKKEQILLGDGEAARIAAVKRADILSDGGLALRLKNQLEVNEVWAKAYSTRPVPRVQFNGGGGTPGTDNDVGDYLKLMKLNALTDLEKKSADSAKPSATTTAK